MKHPREPLPAHADDLPPLPAPYAAALDDGLRALGLSLEPEARSAIDDHVRLLMAWNEAINLTAVRDPVQIARRHVLDSLAAVPLLRDLGARRLLDLGSGGGFPGLPLALVTPAEALLVDSVGKKARFLEAVVVSLGLGGIVRVAADRAETLAVDPVHRERWPVVTARAVAALPDLVELAWPLLQVGGRLVAWKRRPIDAEISAAERALAGLEGAAPRGPRFEALALPDAIPGLEDHVLVVAGKERPAAARFPRSPAQRKRHPW